MRGAKDTDLAHRLATEGAKRMEEQFKLLECIEPLARLFTTQLERSGARMDPSPSQLLGGGFKASTR
jgi:hypothetical protein